MAQMSKEQVEGFEGKELRRQFEMICGKAHHIPVGEYNDFSHDLQLLRDELDRRLALVPISA